MNAIIDSAVDPLDDTDIGEDFTTPPPRMDPAMLYGLIGDIARAGSEGREVNAVAVAAATISWLSARVGPYHYLPIGDKKHPVLLNTLHVGRSAIAGKGESLALLSRIEHHLRGGSLYNDSPLLGLSDSGLSTSEGLALLVHDGYRDGKEEVPPIEDKRLHMVEEEFGGVLERMKREGNALSSSLRELYDGGSIRPRVKSSRLFATHPHFSMHACITPFELREKLDGNSINNGLANRFLIVWAERTCLVPIPPETDGALVRDLAGRLEKAITFAKNRYPGGDINPHRMSERITLTPEAEELYRQEYADLKGRDSMGATVTVLLERRPAITLRLAALFALTDRQIRISRDHLVAALAWSRYHRDSVRFIFGGDSRARQKAIMSSRDRERALNYLRETGGWVSRTELANVAFSKRIRADDLTEVLQGLLADGLLERDEKPNANNPGIKTLYRVVSSAPASRSAPPRVERHPDIGEL
jgi:putative DNA primase/helicase